MKNKYIKTILNISFFLLLITYFCISVSIGQETGEVENDPIRDSNIRLIENENDQKIIEGRSENNDNKEDANSITTETQEENAQNFELTDSQQYHLEITGSFVNVRNGPGINYQKIDLINKGDVFKSLGRRNSWYYIQLSEDRYGWIIKTAARLLPLHQELINEEIKKVYCIGKSIEVRAGPAFSYPVLGQLNGIEELSVYLESQDKRWLLISSCVGPKGWIPAEKVKSLTKKIDKIAFQEEINAIISEISDYYNYQKSKQAQFYKMGWFPSISLMNGMKDISIDVIDERGKVSLTFYLRKINNKIFFPILEETDSFFLPNVNRQFFYIIAKSLFQLESCYEIEIKVNGLKMIEEKKELKWVEIGRTKIYRDKLPFKDIEKISPEKFWQYAESNGELVFKNN
ncbi:MAG: SH3 domain-containing protein [bacterium]